MLIVTLHDGDVIAMRCDLGQAGPAGLGLQLTEFGPIDIYQFQNVLPQ